MQQKATDLTTTLLLDPHSILKARLKTIDDHGFWSWSIISGLLG
jgi:hypothetical protein